MTTGFNTTATNIQGIVQGNQVFLLDSNGLQATIIGNNSPSTGKFTSISLLTALPTTSGGTGQNNFSQNAIIIGGTTATGNLQALSYGTSGYVLVSQGTGVAPTWVQVIPVTSGGTGSTNIPQFYIIMSNGSSPYSGLSPGASGQALISNGSNVAPSFQQINLANVGGILSTASGGTGQFGLNPNAIITGGSTQFSGVNQLSYGTSGYILTSQGNGVLPVWISTLPVTNGGTGTTSINAFSLVMANGTSPFSGISPGTTGNVLTSNGPASQPTFQAIPGSGSGTLAVANGGTGDTTIAQWGILMGNGTSAISAITPNTAGNVLTSNGPSAAPTWQAVPGAGSGVLAVANGGTGVSALPSFSICFGGPSTMLFLSPGTAGFVVTSNGPGNNVSYQQINVTTVAGTLPVSNGGTGQTSFSPLQLMIGGSTPTGSLLQLVSGLNSQILTSTGSGSAPLWISTLPVANGGTGSTSITQYQIVMANGTSPYSGISPSSAGLILTSNGTAAAPTFQTPSVNTVTGILPVANGGTGNSSFSPLNIMLGGSSSTTPLTQLSYGSSGNVLTSGGTSAVPVWVSNLSIASGGTGISSVPQYNLLVGSGGSSLQVLAPGSISGVPLISNGSGAYPSYSGINLASSSAVTGTLAVTNGGTGNNSYTFSKAILATGSTTTSPLVSLGNGFAGQVLVANGALNYPGFQTYGFPQIKNYLINSNFDFWQRHNGTSCITPPGNTFGGYMADRWYVRNTGNSSSVISTQIINSALVGSTNASANYSLKSVFQNAGNSSGNLYITQVIENQLAMELYAETVSFTALVQGFGNVNSIGMNFVYNTNGYGRPTTVIGTTQSVTVSAGTFYLLQVVGFVIGTAMTTSGNLGVQIFINGVSTGNIYDQNNGISVAQSMLNLGPFLSPWSRAEATLAGEFVACQRFCEVWGVQSASNNIAASYFGNGTVTPDYWPGLTSQTGTGLGQTYIIFSPQFRVPKALNSVGIVSINYVNSTASPYPTGNGKGWYFASPSTSFSFGTTIPGQLQFLLYGNNTTTGFPGYASFTPLINATNHTANVNYTLNTSGTLPLQPVTVVGAILYDNDF